MACSKKHGMKAVRFSRFIAKTIDVSPFLPASLLGLPRIWGAIFVQQALSRIIQGHLFVTKTEHKKESLGISQKEKRDYIFSTFFLQTNKLFLCLWEPY